MTAGEEMEKGGREERGKDKEGGQTENEMSIKLCHQVRNQKQRVSHCKPNNAKLSKVSVST